MPLGDIPQFLADSGGKISDLFGSQQFVSVKASFLSPRGGCLLRVQAV
jgi:hypothetical protein